MDFYKRVEQVCQMVPYGHVATYGQIALLCEKPQNSRQVGYAINQRMIEAVPAHRIMNHQGYLSGASAFEHQDMQKWHLEDEGIEVDFDIKKQKYRVNLSNYQWQPTMDELDKIKAIFMQKNI